MELLNGFFYVLNNGIKWRQLPDCSPPWATVYTFYIRARNSGLWDEISAYLVGLARKFAGRDEMPTYGIIDSQSVKTVYSGEARGIDGGKKIKGRKRHIVVDVMGCVPAVVVHIANLHDTVNGLMALCVAKDFFPTFMACCGDSGYRGTFEADAVKK